MKSKPEQQQPRREPERPVSSGGRRSLTRARLSLTQAVGDVLSGSLEVLEGRSGWRAAFGAPAGAPSSHAERLREVVIRDRALFAAIPRTTSIERGEEADGEAPVRAVPVRKEPDRPREREGSAPAGEPIRTRTMARLLAAQGHRARALSIYDELIARDASDAGLQAEREALRGETP